MFDDEVENGRVIFDVSHVSINDFYLDDSYINSHLSAIKENIIPFYLNSNCLDKSIIPIYIFFEKFIDDKCSDVLLKFCDYKSKDKLEKYLLLR